MALNHVSKTIKVFVFLALLAMMPLSAGAVPAAQAQASDETISGTLGVVWYDAATPQETAPLYYLFGEDGTAYLLAIPDDIRAGMGETIGLNNKPVEVTGTLNVQAQTEGSTPVFDVTGLTVQASAADEASAAITGSKPWAIVLCKFKDVSAEPKPVSYFQGLFGNSFGELNHYWQDVSYGNLNINGTTVTPWVTMPSNWSAYISGGADLEKLAKDCTAAANPLIDYSEFYGINLMFNDELDGYAWGGGWYLTLDGVSRYFPLTWEPPWGYQNQSPLAHEMGHAYGLPHSSGPYSATYDSEWDVMSDTWLCSYSTAYGCAAEGLISYNKNQLGWIPTARRYTSLPGSSRLITIERLNEIPSNPNSYLMAKVNIPGGSSYYTVEVRDNVTSVSDGYADLNEYDDNIPSNRYDKSSSPNAPVVVIHSVDPSRNRPANVVDQTMNNDPNDEGAMWRVGEEFLDAPNAISITVVQASGNGFQVRIRNGNAPNNSISSPVVVGALPFSFDEDTRPMDTSSGDPLIPCAGNIQGSGTVWFQFKPVDSGIVSVDTTGSNFDTLLAVWTGPTTALTNVDCDDDSGGSGTSSLTFDANTNTTYYIEAAGKSGMGDLSLHLDMTPCFTATVKVSPTGSGTASLDTAPNCMGNKFLSGSSLSYSAAPNAGYTFKSWTGVGTSTDMPFLTTITANQAVTANFVATASTPTLVSPATNALTTNYLPQFKWKTAVVAAGTVFDHYQFQLATDSAFTAIVSDVNITNISTPEFTPSSDLASNTKFYWRVRIFNSMGNTSVWSPTWTLRTALTPPVLVSPADVSNALTLRPLFDWDAPGGLGTVTGYTIQISKNNTFTQVVHTGNPVSSEYAPTVDMPKNLPLFWHVQAKGANGPSAWSAVRSFNSANSPSTPTPSLPAANALSTNYTPLFKWSVVTLPASTAFKNYHLQVDDSPDFASPVVNDSSITDLLTTQFQVDTPLAHNIQYFWRVRALNTDNEVSNWSSVRTLRTLVDAPALVSPANGFNALTLRPSFDWSPPTGTATISGYTIQVSKNNTFTQIVHTGTPTTSEYTTTVDLPKNLPLFWRVQTRGSNGPSSWSDVRSFNSANSPSTPVPSLPASNALNTDYLPLFKWSAVTLPSPTFFQHYQLQVDDSAAFDSPILNDISITDRMVTQFQAVIPLAHNVKFYWRVRAVNIDDEVSNWSAVRVLRTQIDAPALVSPSNGATGVPLKPLIDWDNVPGNGGYVLQVYKAGTTPVLVKSVTLATDVSQYQFLTNLLPNTGYFWKVQTKGANGPSPWSGQFNFTTTP